MRWHSINLRALSLDNVKIPINKTRLKIAVLKWHPGLPGANELTSLPVYWLSLPLGNILTCTFSTMPWLSLTCWGLQNVILKYIFFLFKENYCILISYKFAADPIDNNAITWTNELIDNKSSLIQVIVWHWKRCRAVTWTNNDKVPWYDACNITRPPWVNSLRPNNPIWWHRSGSTLAQVMACCLMAPSHYLNQSWLIISKVLWHSSEGNFIGDTSATIHWS